MASPLEIRHYLRRYTLDDAKAGAQPMRLDGELYAAPVLQYRVKERLQTTDGKPAAIYQWSEWIDVPFVREAPDGVAPA